MKKVQVVFSGENKDQEVADYFRRYNPFGYDTFVLRENDNEVVVVRNLTCD